MTNEAWFGNAERKVHVVQVKDSREERTDCWHVYMLPVFSVAAVARNRQASLCLNGPQQGHNKVTTGLQQGHNRVTIGSCKTRAKQIEALRKGYVVYIKRVLFFWACIFARVLRDPIVTLL